MHPLFIKCLVLRYYLVNNLLKRGDVQILVGSSVFPSSLVKMKLKIGCLPIGATLCPFVTEEGYWPNNVEIRNKSVHPFCFEIDR